MKGWNLYLAVGIQNPIFPPRVVAAAQGCHLPCITAISQVVRSKCCPGLIKVPRQHNIYTAPSLHFQTTCQNKFLFTPPVLPLPPHTCCLVRAGQDWFRLQISAMQLPCKLTIKPPSILLSVHPSISYHHSSCTHGRRCGWWRGGWTPWTSHHPLVKLIQTHKQLNLLSWTLWSLGVFN